MCIAISFCSPLEDAAPPLLSADRACSACGDMYVCIYIYIYIYKEREGERDVCIYIYIYIIHMCAYICIYIYIYI